MYVAFSTNLSLEMKLLDLQVAMVLSICHLADVTITSTAALGLVLPVR